MHKYAFSIMFFGSVLISFGQGTNESVTQKNLNNVDKAENLSKSNDNIKSFTATVIDTDDDGMPDNWEVTHGLDINDRSLFDSIR